MRSFLVRFVGLSVLSGCTIGINKILITVLGLSMHCSNWQLGVIGAAETAGLALGTIPAGLAVSRGSPRLLYGGVSALLAVGYLVIPHVPSWIALAPIMLVTGSLISFRIVSMSSTFLDKVGELGTAWAGWYKGTLSLGVMSLGPWLGHMLSARIGLRRAFLVSAGLFAFMAASGMFALPSSMPSRQPEKAASRTSWLVPIYADRLVRRACAMEGLSGMSTAYFSTFMLVMLVRDRSWPAVRAIHLLVVYGAVYVGVLLGGGIVLARVNRAVLDRVVYGATAAALAAIPFASAPAHFFALASVFSLGLGFNNLINVTRISESACDRGHVSGVSTLMQMSGGCLGSALGGALGAVLPLQISFAVLAIPWLLATALAADPWPSARERALGILFGRRAV